MNVSPPSDPWAKITNLFADLVGLVGGLRGLFRLLAILTLATTLTLFFIARAVLTDGVQGGQVVTPLGFLLVLACVLLIFLTFLGAGAVVVVWLLLEHRKGRPTDEGSADRRPPNGESRMGGPYRGTDPAGRFGRAEPASGGPGSNGEEVAVVLQTEATCMDEGASSRRPVVDLTRQAMTDHSNPTREETQFGPGSRAIKDILTRSANVLRATSDVLRRQGGSHRGVSASIKAITASNIISVLNLLDGADDGRLAAIIDRLRSALREVEEAGPGPTACGPGVPRPVRWPAGFAEQIARKLDGLALEIDRLLDDLV